MLELYGKKLCIVGCGSVGTACAKRFQAFGCNVTGITRNPKKHVFYDRIYGMEFLHREIEKADIVIIAIPLSKETRNLFDENLLSVMKEKSILINLSRGQIIDEKALLRNVNRYLGVILDVFYNEPLDADSPFWDCENVMITPHNSFVSDGNQKRLDRCVIENIKEYKETSN